MEADSYDSDSGAVGTTSQPQPVGSTANAAGTSKRVIMRRKKDPSAAEETSTSTPSPPFGAVVPPTAVTEASSRGMPSTNSSAAAAASGAVGIKGPATSTSPATGGAAGGGGPVQIVHSAEEANALVKRLKQMETEGAALAHTLTKVCDENANLTTQIAQLEDRVASLARAPLAETSVLHSLFEPEKTGWFGGSKSAAREQLEKLSEALQSEFMAYKASHASSNEEVQALMTGMQNAHMNAQELSKVVEELQHAINGGPMAVTVKIVSVEDDGSGAGAVTVNELKQELNRERNRADGLAEDLRRLNEELRGKSAETIKLQNDLKELRTQQQQHQQQGAVAASAAVSAASSLKMEVEVQKLRDETTRLRQEMHQLQENTKTQEQLLTIKKDENDELMKRLEQQQSRHAEEVSSLKKQMEQSLNASLSAKKACPTCDTLRAELERAKADVQTAELQLQATRKELRETNERYAKEQGTMQSQLAETKSKLAAKESALEAAISPDQHRLVQAKATSLEQELTLSRSRIQQLETSNRELTDRAAVPNTDNIDEAQILATLDRNKEKIASLEFSVQSLQQQLQQAQSYAVMRDQDAQRLERTVTEDKQRVAFLLKKCAAATADMQAANAAKDALAEEKDKLDAELKKQRRLAEDIPALQKRYDDLAKEKQQLDSRVAAAAELEERLVKAKETIAIMELAQSKSINMSQYAALQADKDKLQHSIEPLQRKLDEANKEVERLKALTEAQQMVSGNQRNSVEDLEGKLTALQANEAKMREKVAALTTENERLTQLNASLESQMTDMQDGIKEMAVQMEKGRADAKATAEANAQKERDQLKLELENAKATIAGFQATQGKYVAEGLYQSTVSERDRLSEELKKKTFDLEKLKSEILIYRQTIADLETENDEHVKEIEDLQDRHQGERNTLTERVNAEQKRSSELASQVETLKSELERFRVEEERASLKLKESEERNVKQKRAFEEKCRAEEKLIDQLAQARKDLLEETDKHEKDVAAANAKVAAAEAAAAAASNVASTVAAAAPHREPPPPPLTQTTATNTSLVLSPRDAAVAPAKTASPLSPPTPATHAVAAASSSSDAADATAASNKRLYDLQCENDRLRGELKRAQLKFKTDSDDDQRTITMLQAQLKSRMPADTRAVYEVEVNKSTALKKSNEALIHENEQLKKQLADGGKPSMYNPVVAPASSPAESEAAQMRALQLQQQMDAQKETFQMAMIKATEDSAALQARVKELEAQLQRVGNGSLSQLAPPANDDDAERDEDGAARTSLPGDDLQQQQQRQHADPNDPTAAPGKPKKKVKKVKKVKKSLAEQVAGATEEGDLLATPPHLALTGEADELSVRLHVVEADLAKAQKELETLRTENATLKAAVASLTEELQQMDQDLQHAEDDLHTAQEEMEKERAELQKRIAAREEETHPLLGMQPSRNNSLSSKPTASFTMQNVTDLEMQMRCIKDENEKLRTTNRELASEVEEALEASQRATERLQSHERQLSLGSGGDLASLGGSVPPAVATAELKQLRKQLKQREAEIKALTAQLMPTKAKLVEYMAMADRLGLQYPFPAEFEGTTLLRMRAMHLDAGGGRAVSAPQQRAAAVPKAVVTPPASTASPAPLPPTSSSAVPAVTQPSPRGEAAGAANAGRRPGGGAGSTGTTPRWAINRGAAVNDDLR